MARLMEKYRTELAPKLMGGLQLKNVMQVPRIDKVVVNMGLGEAIQNIKVLESAVEELGLITGQKAVITRAKRSIAQFKLREGMPIGCMVTLRRERAYEFLDRLINVALPRVRDFKGVSPKGFDGRGNYTMGIQEQIIFPEIDLEKIDKVKGLNVTVVTSAGNDEGGRALLSSLGMPFRK
ncbi:MAG: 50S ribosomal protein L5 [Desulfuromonadaceae bacterium]|nr:50S ribosomal protein L5 [Desulfuromonadaceae bacterium]